MDKEGIAPNTLAVWNRVGTQLRATRERKGISLHDVSMRTRIKISLLEALEQGEMEKLPRGPFPRSFARAYALEIGLNPEALLADLHSEPVLPPLPAVPPYRETWQTLRAFAGRLLAGAVLLAAAILLPRWTPPEQTKVADAGAAVATTGGQAPDALVFDATRRAAQPLATSATPTGVPAVSQAPLTFALRAITEVWIEVTADGRRVAYDLLSPATEKIFTAQQTLTLRIGDAAAIEYTVNGRRGVPLGRSGQVRDLQLSPATVTALQLAN